MTGLSVLDRAMARVAASSGIETRAAFSNYAGRSGEDMMDFSGALGFLKRGARIRRQLWPTGMYIVLVIEQRGIDEERRIEQQLPEGRFFWSPRQADILAGDWVEVPPRQ